MKNIVQPAWIVYYHFEEPEEDNNIWLFWGVLRPGDTKCDMCVRIGTYSTAQWFLQISSPSNFSII